MEGLFFLLIQPVVVTPVLCLLLWLVAWRGWRQPGWSVQMRYFALAGGVSTLMIFVLGFFTDVERISFHWPLPGYLALMVAAPALLQHWAPGWRRWLLWLGVAVGGVLGLGYYAMAGSPQLRQVLADNKFYPRNFIGWEPLAEAVQEELAQMPADTQVVAGSFKVGAELGFQLGDASIAVLPHALNDRHGRTAQLALWGLIGHGRTQAPQLLVISPADQRFRNLLQRYHQLCEWFGPLPGPRTVSIDHGRQRFLLFRLPAQAPVPVPGDAAPCVAPAIAWWTPRCHGRWWATGCGSVAGPSRTGSVCAGWNCWWMGSPGRWPTMAMLWMYARPGRAVPTRITRMSASAPAWTCPRCRPVPIGWGCACMATMAVRKTGPSSGWSCNAERPAPLALTAQGKRKPAWRNSWQVAIKGRPTRAVGSLLSIAWNRLMPSPSHLKLPAQSSGCSCWT